MVKHPDETLVDTTNARNEEYRRLLEKAEAEHECPFCPENLCKGNTILDSADNWRLVVCRYPYPNSATHLLIVPRLHFTEIGAISADDWDEIQALVARARRRLPILGIGGALAIRFGTNSGGTIRHLHFHLIAPVTEMETGRVFPGKHVSFPIG